MGHRILLVAVTVAMCSLMGKAFAQIAPGNYDIQTTITYGPQPLNLKLAQRQHFASHGLYINSKGDLAIDAIGQCLSAAALASPIPTPIPTSPPGSSCFVTSWTDTTTGSSGTETCYSADKSQQMIASLSRQSTDYGFTATTTAQGNGNTVLMTVKATRRGVC